jgi:hypothetical protein
MQPGKKCASCAKDSRYVCAPGKCPPLQLPRLVLKLTHRGIVKAGLEELAAAVWRAWAETHGQDRGVALRALAAASAAYIKANQAPGSGGRINAPLATPETMKAAPAAAKKAAPKKAAPKKAAPKKAAPKKAAPKKAAPAAAPGSSSQSSQGVAKAADSPPAPATVVAVVPSVDGSGSGVLEARVRGLEARMAAVLHAHAMEHCLWNAVHVKGRDEKAVTKVPEEKRVGSHLGQGAPRLTIDRMHGLILPSRILTPNHILTVLNLDAILCLFPLLNILS